MLCIGYGPRRIGVSIRETDPSPSAMLRIASTLSHTEEGKKLKTAAPLFPERLMLP